MRLRLAKCFSRGYAKKKRKKTSEIALFHAYNYFVISNSILASKMSLNSRLLRVYRLALAYILTKAIPINDKPCLYLQF